MTPFEALHPHEAFFLQGLYQRGFCVRGDTEYPETLFVKRQSPRRRRTGHRYARLIAEIRQKPDRTL